MLNIFNHSACYGSTYTKIGRIQRRLAWPLRKDDMQICEALHILKYIYIFNHKKLFSQNPMSAKTKKGWAILQIPKQISRGREGEKGREEWVT